MHKTVHLNELAAVEILFPDDFRQLAAFMLRGFDATANATVGKAWPTVYGVAGAYARLFIDVDFEKILAKVRKTGIDLSACVEWETAAGDRSSR